MTDADADEAPVPDGLRWSIKYSFVDYIGRMPDGQCSVTDGATAITAPAFVYELASREGQSWRFRGDVRFAGHFGMLFVRIANPWLDLDGDRAEVSIDDPWVEGKGGRMTIAVATLEPAAADGDAQQWTGTDVRLTAAGSEIFNSVYPEGDLLDPFTIVLGARG